jgi:hypothetical protein
VKKKLRWHTTFGEISVEETEYNRSGQRLRPFRDAAQVTCRGCSVPLQRVIVDFGSDNTFGRTPNKLEEHYGISLPSSTIRHLTEHHAKQMQKPIEPHSTYPESAGCETLIVETDGSMIPIVVTDESAKDKRKNQQELWKEVRLCLAHPQGEVTPHFGATFQESVDETGKVMFDTACQAGFGKQTYVHSVGDGATWISEPVENQFGRQGHYLIDFYPICEYLGAAANDGCETANKAQWMNKQKTALKAGERQTVLDELKPHLEADEVENSKAPVRACHRYLKNRKHQLDYPKAIEHDLPIGSGEIESAHRYIIQQRLKLPGAWWTPENARGMLALRIMRANGLWDDYWQEFDKAA